MFLAIFFVMRKKIEPHQPLKYHYEMQTNLVIPLMAYYMYCREL